MKKFYFIYFSSTKVDYKTIKLINIAWMYNEYMIVQLSILCGFNIKLTSWLHYNFTVDEPICCCCCIELPGGACSEGIAGRPAQLTCSRLLQEEPVWGGWSLEPGSPQGPHL